MLKGCMNMVELNEKQQEIQNIVPKDVFDGIESNVVMQMAKLTLESAKMQTRTHCVHGFTVHNFTFDYFPNEIDFDEVQINWASIVMQAYKDAKITNHLYFDDEVVQAIGKRNFDRLVAGYKVALGECFDLLGYCRTYYNPNKYKLNTLSNSYADDDLAKKYEGMKSLWQINWERFVGACEILTKLLNNLDEMDEEGDQQC